MEKKSLNKEIFLEKRRNPYYNESATWKGGIFMLIKISVENFKSFDQKEELSMISSSKMQGNKNHRLQIKQTKLLKNAVVYGANAKRDASIFAAQSKMKIKKI
jgi:hypothetical protein